MVAFKGQVNTRIHQQMYNMHYAHKFLVEVLKLAYGDYMEPLMLPRDLVACENTFSMMVITGQPSPTTFDLTYKVCEGERWRLEEVGVLLWGETY